MHPYDHARSSARIHGGTWRDYWAFHHWFDATKSAHCHFSHRALHHHLQGVDEAASIFGLTMRNADGINVSTHTLGHQHLEEDGSLVPSAEDWLIDFQQPEWLPDAVPSADELAHDSAMRFGGEEHHYLPLHRWFLATSAWVATKDHLIFRHHSFGIFEAESRFGPVIGPASGPFVPTRVVAERHVRDVLGRIPPASDLLRRIKGQRWMLQATSPRKLGLD